MPVRATVATWLGEKFQGAQVWDGRVGECKTMPTAEYDRNREAADALYVALVNRIDWPRVLIESMGRHGALEDAGVHPETRHAWMDERTCAECIREALLAGDRLSSWVAEGKPLEAPAPAAVDFAAVLGAALRYRQTGENAR